MSAEKMLSLYANMVSDRLKEIIENKNAPHILKKAMDYSLCAGGKRIRPALMLEFYRLLGSKPEDILNFACAVEMIHTYSLIHDDLPCMDDDDLRRGRLSNHKVFGEATALLAGDALLTLAFETASCVSNNIKPENALKAVNLLGKAAGMCNMVGGQVLDLESEGKNITIDELNEIQRGKTVALLKVTGLIACALYGADEKQTQAVKKYLENIGRAFQIRDDILDVIGDEEKLGKPIGSDVAEEKNTFVSFFGLEKSQKLVEDLTAEAKQVIAGEFKDCDDLLDFADMMANRNN